MKFRVPRWASELEALFVVGVLLVLVVIPWWTGFLYLVGVL